MLILLAAAAWTGNADWSFGDRKDYRTRYAASSSAVTQIAFAGMPESPLSIPTALLDGSATYADIGYYACSVAGQNSSAAPLPSCHSHGGQVLVDPRVGTSPVCFLSWSMSSTRSGQEKTGFTGCAAVCEGFCDAGYSVDIYCTGYAS